MKYHYYFHDSTNRSLDGWIEAHDRNDAYKKLRARGIKASKIEGRDPIAWKRWAAIAVLTLMCIASVLYAVMAKKNLEVALAETDRSQLYGDAYTIQKISSNGWRETFESGDAWLARHAIPGKECDCASAASKTVEISTTQLVINKNDPVELKKMKQMINGMKHELEDYLRAGGTSSDYMKLCDERIDKEKKVLRRSYVRLDTLKRHQDTMSVESFVAEWEQVNDSLRALGLPTVIVPLSE